MNRVEYSRKRRTLRKLIAKAVRQHKKRSHLREELDQINDLWIRQCGGIFRFMFRNRWRRKFVAALSENNPLLKVMEKHSAIKRVTGGHLIEK